MDEWAAKLVLDLLDGGDTSKEDDMAMRQYFEQLWMGGNYAKAFMAIVADTAETYHALDRYVRMKNVAWWILEVEEKRRQ